MILSGGDPLVLEDDVLCKLVERISRMEGIRRLRIHTRMPVVVPQRVTDTLVEGIRQVPLAVVMVLHVNHPAEIDGDVAQAIGRLVDAGIPLLSQSVLLQGVNDHCDILAELYERLIDLRVPPYYLHQLDRVSGAAHFEVPEKKGVELITGLRALLPGYAVPRYVRDMPGSLNKQVLA